MELIDAQPCRPGSLVAKGTDLERESLFWRECFTVDNRWKCFTAWPERLLTSDNIPSRGVTITTCWLPGWKTKDARSMSVAGDKGYPFPFMSHAQVLSTSGTGTISLCQDKQVHRYKICSRFILSPLPSSLC